MSVTTVPISPIKKGSIVKLWLSLGLLAAVAIALAWYGASGAKWSTTASGLRYQIIAEGKGPHPAATDIATFDYVGRLANGTIFDSSEGKGPAQAPIFAVVPGFAEGLQLMTRGARYRFRISPELGYGPQGQPPTIPANTDIEFDVTLHDFRPLTAEEIQQLQMLQQQGGR